VKKGVNFAYSGTTALPKSFFDKRGIDIPPAAYSLATQLDWFHKLKPSLCKSKKGFIKSPLKMFLQNIFVFFSYN